MKNLHIFPNDKFTNSYINFINNFFSSNEHLFLVPKTEVTTVITENENVISLEMNLLNRFYMLRKMYKSEKIILHGLFDSRTVLMLFLNPWLLSKCYWVIWGGDLYYYRFKPKTLKAKFYEIVRHKVIKKLAGLITHIKGDYELAKLWYGAEGKHYYSYLYPSNQFKEVKLTPKKNIDTIFVQVGNSADSTNNHLEIFEMLQPFTKTISMTIICPLSYGEKNYQEKIIKEGKRIFGEKFNPLIEFMSLEEYLKILSKIDVAIFNHHRQQAIGNITTLLGLGKKVYIRDDITTWEFCEAHGLKVENLCESLKNIDKPLSEEEKESNIHLVKKHFSQEKLMLDWEKIFDEKL